MMFEGNSKKEPPSLVQICVWKAIDNVDDIGYVGGVEFGLLEQILEHCKPEQLMHIEDSTQDTDLSPVTAKFWKRFYEKAFNGNRRDEVEEEFKHYKDNNQWRKLYEVCSFPVGFVYFSQVFLCLVIAHVSCKHAKMSGLIQLAEKLYFTKRFKPSKAYNPPKAKFNIKYLSLSASTGLSSNMPLTSRTNSYGEQVKHRRNKTSISPPGVSANAPSASRSNPCGFARNLPINTQSV